MWRLPPAASGLQGKGKGQLLFPGQPAPPLQNSRASCSGSCRLSAAGVFLKCILSCAASGQELEEGHPGEHGVNRSEEAKRPVVHLPPAGSEGGQVKIGPLYTSEKTELLFFFSFANLNSWKSTMALHTFQGDGGGLRQAAEERRAPHRERRYLSHAVVHPQGRRGADQRGQTQAASRWSFRVFLCLFELDPVDLSVLYKNVLWSSWVRAKRSRLLSFRVGPLVRGSGQPPGSGQGDGRPQPRGQSPPAQSGSSGTSGCS